MQIKRNFYLHYILDVVTKASSMQLELHPRSNYNGIEVVFLINMAILFKKIFMRTHIELPST